MNSKVYYEKKHLAGNPAVACDEIRAHFEQRSRVGNGIVVSHQAGLYIAKLRAAWQQRVRRLQKMRDQTIDADEKLRLTQVIIQLQSVTIGPAGTKCRLMVCDYPALFGSYDGQAWLSVYITYVPPLADFQNFLKSRVNAPLLLVGDSLPASVNQLCLSKKVLEERCDAAWSEVLAILKHQSINLSLLANPSAERSQHINESLEYLLDEHVAWEFLEAYKQYRLLSLQSAPHAQTKKQKREQDTVNVLARQVQSFSGFDNFMHQQNGHLHSDEPSFFLNDSARLLALRLWSPMRSVR